jgi:D-threo-aldose 1-dehydrogenase
MTSSPSQASLSQLSQPLELRKLGRSALQVTSLGVGTAPLGDLYQRVAEPDAVDMLRTGYELGLRLFDTAPLYGAGLAEQRTGHELRQRPRDSLVLSTKVGRYYRAAPGRADRGNWAGGLEFNAVLDYSYDGAMRSFEQSLLRLGLARVDVLLIHDVDVHTHGSREACDRRFDQAMEGAYRALSELRRNGDVKAIGVGVNESDMCARFARAGDFDCMLLAGRYTLLEQGALDEFLPLCEQKNIGVLAGGVYNSGILASGPKPGAKYDYADAPAKVRERVAQLDAVCSAHGVPLAAAAIQFPLAHPKVSSVVIGAISAAEIRQSFELMSQNIPAALWRDLKNEGLVRADAPVPG